MIFGAHCLLELIHLVANVIAYLDCFVFINFEFLTTPILENSLASLASAFYFLTPFFMFFNLRKEDLFLTVMTTYFNYLEKLS